MKPENLDYDDDEESGVPATATGSYFQTTNEVVIGDVMVPDIEEVGPGEELQSVGEVMSVVGDVAIVKGTASEIAGRGAEGALDSGTLLVFEDRTVLGYVSELFFFLSCFTIYGFAQVYETFGPTSQPLYQVKFNDRYPLDTIKVQINRPVFHVPHRSKFVFPSHLKKVKGSDASNAHDEEPADDELEFSDDEQEAAFKISRKRK
jgi:H/ACA ribonucleoprotein complex non-core subunit NAF1